MTEERNFAVENSIRSTTSDMIPYLPKFKSKRKKKKPPVPTPNQVPSLQNWSGELNYHVEFNRAEDRARTTPWIVRKVGNYKKLGLLIGCFSCLVFLETR